MGKTFLHLQFSCNLLDYIRAATYLVRRRTMAEYQFAGSCPSRAAPWRTGELHRTLGLFPPLLH